MNRFSKFGACAFIAFRNLPKTEKGMLLGNAVSYKTLAISGLFIRKGSFCHERQDSVHN